MINCLKSWMLCARGLMVLIIAVVLCGCTTTHKPVATGRFYHVGLVWLNEPGNPVQRRTIIEAAHAFAREISEVQLLSVGQAPPATSSYVDASFDVCVVMQFADRQALERYNRHPVHVKAAEESFLPLSRKVLFYDFITE